MADHLRFCFGMGGQIEVQPVGPAIHQCLQPGGAFGIVGLQRDGIQEQLLTQVGPDGLFAFGFRSAAQVGDVVGFDPVEIVFGLRIGHAEHRIGVGLAMDMGDAPVVAGDADGRGTRLQAGEIIGREGRHGEKGEQADGCEKAQSNPHFWGQIARFRLGCRA